MDSNLESSQSETGPQSVLSQDSKNQALLLWLATLLFGFIPGLIVYLVKKDDPYLTDQAKETINWSITASLAYIAALILSIIAIGLLLIPIIMLCHLVFCILGMVKTYSGESFRVPFAWRPIK